MKKSYITAAFIAVAATAWILSGQFNDGPNGEGAMETASNPDHAALAQVRVRAVTAQDHAIELVLFGRTEAERKVEMKAETSGRVAARLTNKGETVIKGKAMIRLAMDDRQARLRKAEAVLKQHTIAFDAAQQLSKKQFRSKVKLAETEAELESARAGLAAIRLDIERTSIRAPFDGVADRMPVEIGDYVAVGDVVAQVVDLDPIIVVGEVSEVDVASIRLGAQADVRLSAGGRASGGQANSRLRGEVRYISRVGAQATRTFRVEIAVANPGGRLTEGLTAEINLPLGRVRAHLTTPAVLTLSDAGVVGVKHLDADNIVRFSPVEIVADTPDGIWLTGLPERATIITVGQEFVLPGQTVIPVTEGGEG